MKKLLSSINIQYAIGKYYIHINPVEYKDNKEIIWMIQTRIAIYE